MAADPRSFQRVGASSYRYRASPRRRVLSIGATLAAIAVFAGILFYAYRYGAKPGAGAGGPPLIQADAGPVKVRPEQPGGMQVPFQDNLVYDQVTRDKRQPTVERLLPRPEAPMARPEPAPPAPAQPAQPVQSAQSAAQAPPAAPPPNLVVAAPAAPAAQQKAAPAGNLVVAPPAATPAQQKAAPPSLASVAPAPQQPATAPQASVPVRTFPTPAAGPGPAPAPAAAAPPPAAQSTAALPPPQARGMVPALPPPGPAQPLTTEAAVRPPPPGSARLQLGSVQGEAEARAEWARLKQRYPDLLGGMDMALQRADLGDKGVFYRIQAGPIDDSRAQATCSKLRAQRADCFIVRR